MSKLLNAEIINTSAQRTIPRVVARRNLRADQVDWFLPIIHPTIFVNP